MEKEPETNQLSDGVIKNLVIAKVEKDFRTMINSIDFTKDGKKVLVTDDTTLSIYDCLTGNRTKLLYNKINKIKICKFTHNENAVIAATKNKPFQVHYWSIHENAIIKIFEGHTMEITGLELNPENDFFLTTSRDKTCRLWDLASNDPYAKMVFELENASSPPVATFNQTGLVFAVAYSVNNSNSKIKLFDTKKCSEDCFVTW